ncbi:hypothetical protein [Candidatus Azobacteroides pseudotrichonymphae]|jgi:hypothetical protein|uniref:hypothetical protein n=1 Tax=Candidatus Azobacteroides pseudotrichonymphae TaxID=511435 RepID=UPI00223C81A6|nr:hypothetical protein [Candidatus Azobacteroides pseudotrichonymphae]
MEKLLLMGKSVLGDNPKLVSKNLPVKMMEKLQVIEQKSGKASLTVILMMEKKKP